MAGVNEETVRITKLNNENYHTWSIRAKAVLIQKSVWVAIDPGYGPAILSVKEKQDNDKALAFLYLVVEDQYLDDIEDCVRAKEAWEILEELNSKFGILHVMQLMKELFNMQKAASEDMMTYVSRVVNSHHKLKKGGYGFDDRELALIILMGLPKSYEPLILNLEQNENEITTKEVKKKLLLEEKRQKAREENDTASEESDTRALKTGTKGKWPASNNNKK